jgi:hypothetical protein
MSDPVRDTIEAEIAKITKIATTPIARAYGIDLVCVDDIDSRASETDPDSYASIAQDLYHRITTPRAGLPDDRNFGEDVSSYLSGEAQPGDLASIEGRVANECAKDDRVSRADVTAVVDAGMKSITLTIVVTPEDSELQSFTLIVAVTDGVATLEAILREAS